MGHAKEKLLHDSAADYDRDFYLWCHEQADMLRQGRFAELDLPNVIEELESMGRSDKRALISAYRVLIQHLLKWQFQPAKRSASWRQTIRVQRDQIELLEEENPSLAAKSVDHVSRAFAKAREAAAEETALSLSRFPDTCLYSLENLRDFDWMPD